MHNIQQILPYMMFQVGQVKADICVADAIVQSDDVAWPLSYTKDGYLSSAFKAATHNPISRDAKLSYPVAFCLQSKNLQLHLRNGCKLCQPSDGCLDFSVLDHS